MYQIGENIKRLRKSKSLSIRALAKLVDISHNTLASYERKSIMPSLENSFKLARFFDVPLEYLLLGEKATVYFKDIELLELFKEVDSLPEEDRSIAKKFLSKLIKNSKERKQLMEEAE